MDSREKHLAEFDKIHKDAKEGGEVAGKARLDIESRSDKKVVSRRNFLQNKSKNQLSK